MSRSFATVSWACAVPLLLASGCFDGENEYEDSTADDSGVEPEPQPEPLQEEPFTGPCVPEAWIDDADTIAATGVSVSFALTGTDVRVDGDAPSYEAVPAPFSVNVSANGGEPVVVFENAAVDGAEAGTVVITGAQILAESGAFAELVAPTASFGDLWVDVSLAAGADDGARPDLGPTADPAHVAALAAAEPVDVRADAVRITAYTSAYIVTPTGNVPLTGPFEVSAARLFWPHGTAIQAAGIEARYGGDVFIGLDSQSGEFIGPDAPAAELPIAILGRDAHLVVGPTVVSTVEDMSVQQAMGASDVLLSSEVDLSMCQADTLVFYPSQTRVLRFAYRQPEGLTDAVFANVVVAADDGTSWTTRIEIDPTLPYALTTAVEQYSDTTWAGALVGFIEAWVDAVQAIVEGLACAFTLGFFCGDDDSASAPTPLVQYPAWMEAGAIGEFELEVTAPATAGTYEVVVTIVGDNYEATVPTTVIVQ